jgi:glycosyltransferase involved in cell wall biosynthesis
MVCGRPVICTKGTRSGFITEKEKCGIVVDYSIDSLRDGIIKLRDNPKLCETLGKNALKAALDKYNWEKQEEKLIKIYEQIT